jgi:hypothetical protein
VRARTRALGAQVHRVMHLLCVCACLCVRVHARMCVCARVDVRFSKSARYSATNAKKGVTAPPPSLKAAAVAVKHLVLKSFKHYACT